MLKKAICCGFLFAVCGLAQSSSVTYTQVIVDVRPEGALAWQGDSVVFVKVRLAPGTQARVWADESCGAPAVSSQVLPASGMLAINLAAIDGVGKAMVCLSSSDGRISASLPAIHN
jgi:hypothetical protein